MVLQSCGSVSSIRPVVNNEPVDIKSHKAIVINDFTNETPHEEVDKIAKETFPNNLRNNISESFLFESVHRNKRVSDSLIISGKITKYKKGNSFLRALVVFGAGRAHFFSDVDLIDGNTRKKIGTIEVRKKSWLLGGQIAANQTPGVLMQSAVSNLVKKIKTPVAK